MKNIRYYLNLPYTVIVRRDEDGDYVARVEELPGCSIHGKTPQAALKNLEEVQRVWVEDCLKQGDPIPLPEAERPLPSGKWVQRVPRTLHRELVRLAKREKVSLNQLVTSLLSKALGMRKPKGVARLAARGAGLSPHAARRKTSTASTK